MNRVNRRTVFKIGGASAAGLLLSGTLTGCNLPSNASTQGSAGKVLKSKIRLPEPFQVSLPTPPTLQPMRSDNHADHYEIVQRKANVEILPGKRTAIWGYNGVFPGPTIHARRDRTAVVHHRNELSVPTVVHLHGGRTPSESDGYPTDYVLPVGGFPASDLRSPGRVHEHEFAYRYPLRQRAATLWYHDHRMDFTGPSCWRGLAGFFIVHDDIEDALQLPEDDRDIPLMIVDRSFAADGSLQYPSVDTSLKHTPGVTSEYMSGVLGDCILVNGKPWPVLDVAAARYRFRLLNASNARRYRLTVDPEPDDGPAFTQIGTGQGLLHKPRPLEKIDIAQAERFDVIIDFSRYPVGTKVTLQNEHGSDRTSYVMQFRVTHTAPDSSRIPDALASPPSIDEADVVRTREFVFARGGAEQDGMVLWTINGKPFDPDRIDARVKKGTTERWKIHALNLPHPFHIHEDSFQVVNGDNGERPGPYEHGRKDVIDLDNGGRGELLIRFDGYRGKYVFHCHNLEHEDMMMMANFEVV